MFSEHTDASRRKLAARRAEMPVIDAARVPLGKLRERWPRLALAVFLWLKLVRPVVLTVCWLVVVRYAWAHFFGLPEDMPLWKQVTLYGVAVVVIVLSMLVLAPIRQREVDSELPPDEAESTLAAISEFAQVAQHDLERWQQAQRLVVRHDEHGGVDWADEGARHRGREPERARREPADLVQ